jgi:hypothetical protein
VIAERIAVSTNDSTNNDQRDEGSGGATKKERLASDSVDEEEGVDSVFTIP